MIQSNKTESASSPIDSLIARLSLGPQAMRIIAFIAARRGEGTSTIAREYAAMLAMQMGQKVLLVLASLPPEDKDAGIVDAVATGHSPIQAAQPAGDGLFTAHWVGKSGRRNKAAQMIHTAQLWDTLLEAFDSIVMDIASLQSSFEGVALAAKAEASVLVVAAETTPAPVVTHLRNRLTAAGAKIAGVVMNKRRYYIPAKVYARL